MKPKTFLLLSALLMGVSCAAPKAAQTSRDDVVDFRVSRVWGDGTLHCAFTSMTVFRGRYYLAFREGAGHIFGEDLTTLGRLRVLVSDDGEKWTPVALIGREGYDMRDPSLSVTPDGKLLISTGGAHYNEARELIDRGPMYSISEDGIHFSEPEACIVESDVITGMDWIWKVDWKDGTGYGVIYSIIDAKDGRGFGTQSCVRLLSTPDGIHFKDAARLNVSPAEYPNEAAVHFLPDGRMAMLLRLDRAPYGLWGVSEAPYTDWKFSRIRLQLGGPDFIVTGPETLIGGSRAPIIGGTNKTIVFKGTTDGVFDPICILPSAGDTSYPGFLIVGDELWVSYYSCHESMHPGLLKNPYELSKPSVYLAKIPLTLFRDR